MTLVKADLVGSDEQLALTVEKYKSKCVIKALDGTWVHGERPNIKLFTSLNFLNILISKVVI